MIKFAIVPVLSSAVRKRERLFPMMVLSSQSILEKQLVCWFTFHIKRRDCKGELSIENTVHHYTHTLGYSCLIADTSELLRVKVHITGSADFYMDNV